MSTRASDWAWQRIAEQGQKLSDAARMVLLYLAERADEDGYCWPKIATIAEGVGGKVRLTVTRSIDGLCEAGLVRRESRWREDGAQAANGYQLLILAGQPPISPAIPPHVVSDTPPASPATPPPVSPAIHLEPSVKNHQQNHQEQLPGAAAAASPNGEAKRRGTSYDYDGDPLFARFWEAYPRKVGKPEAFRAWKAARRRRADPELVIAAALRYRNDSTRKPEYTKHPGPWLNAERYNDAPPSPLLEDKPGWW